MIQWGMNNKIAREKKPTLHRPANVKTKAYLCVCMVTGVKLNANCGYTHTHQRFDTFETYFH